MKLKEEEKYNFKNHAFVSNLSILKDKSGHATIWRRGFGVTFCSLAEDWLLKFTCFQKQSNERHFSEKM